MKKYFKKRQIIAAGLLSVAIFAVFYLFDPQKTAVFPQCPFFLLTGYRCPGCGSQRAIHELIHLNIVEAFDHNPLVVLILPYILLGVYWAYFDGAKAHPVLQKKFFGKYSAIIIILSIIAFGIARNFL